MNTYKIVKNQIELLINVCGIEWDRVGEREGESGRERGRERERETQII